MKLHPGMPITMVPFSSWHALLLSQQQQSENQAPSIGCILQNKTIDESSKKSVHLDFLNTRIHRLCWG
jgi:hypothetical protein